MRTKISLVVMFVVFVATTSLASAQDSGQKAHMICAPEDKACFEKEVMKAMEGIKASETEEDVTVEALEVFADRVHNEALRRIAKESDKDPDKRKTRKELQRRADRVLKMANRQADLRRSVNLEGCGPETWVNPKIEGFKLLPSIVQPVLNASSFPVDLADERGEVVVRQLCPGGRVTLTRVFGFMDGQRIQVRFNAVASGPNGEVASLSSPEVYMDSYYNQYEPRRYQRLWVIRFPGLESRLAQTPPLSGGTVVSPTVKPAGIPFLSLFDYRSPEERRKSEK